jgi:hypothetical protein
VIVFILLAAVGLVLSALAHCSTFFGVDPQTVCPAVFLLHPGIFVVFIPAILTKKRGSKWEQQAPYAPKGLVRLTSVLFVYCFINFAIFMARVSGSAEINPRGGYELTSHGHLIRAISEDEYHFHRALEVRGVSGHWMVFYSVSMVFLVSRYREQRVPAPLEIAPRMLTRQTI